MEIYRYCLRDALSWYEAKSRHEFYIFPFIPEKAQYTDEHVRLFFWAASNTRE